MNKKKVWIITTASVLSIAVITITIAIVLKTQNENRRLAEQQRLDNIEIERLSKRFNKDTEYIKARRERLNSWEQVEVTLMSEEMSFTSKEASDLYYSGYLPEDIKKAQELSVRSGVDRMKIIKTRGVYPKLMDWNKVIKKLKLDLRSDAEKFGLSKKDIKYFKEKGYSKVEIISIALTVMKKGNLKNVKKELEKGKTIDELRREYGLTLQ